MFNFFIQIYECERCCCYYRVERHGRDSGCGSHLWSSSFYHSSYHVLPPYKRFVDASLHRFCELGLRMQKLRISVSLLEAKESSPLFDKWVELAVENGVKELDFEVISDKNSVYTLPQTIFSAKLLNFFEAIWLWVGAALVLHKSPFSQEAFST